MSGFDLIPSFGWYLLIVPELVTMTLSELKKELEEIEERLSKVSQYL